MEFCIINKYHYIIEAYKTVRFAFFNRFIMTTYRYFL